MADAEKKNLPLPIILVNFKTYEQSIGKKAVPLAKICENVAADTGVTIVVAVSPVDVYRIASELKIPVFSQHMDPVPLGANTGKDVPEAIMENGAVGILLNHSEDRLRLDVLDDGILKSKQLGLITVACANTERIAKAIAALEPDFIAVEPPELIGGDISISQAKPEVITNTIKMVNEVKAIPVLCGAGVKNGNDARIAAQLGSVGILLASGVTKAKNPEEVLKEIAIGLKEGYASRPK